MQLLILTTGVFTLPVLGKISIIFVPAGANDPVDSSSYQLYISQELSSRCLTLSNDSPWLPVIYQNKLLLISTSSKPETLITLFVFLT